MRIIQVERREGFVALLHDGMLDNLEGFIYVHPGSAPPPLRSAVFGVTLVDLVPLRNGWYWFVTT